MFDFKFDWCEEMKCGVAVMDEQHQELFRIVREIEQLIMHECRNVTSQQLLDIVCELREYTAYHFYTEEDLMDKYTYPSSAKHKAEHLALKTRILQIDLPALSNDPNRMLSNLKVLLQHFLFNHILQEDKTLGAYLKTCMD